LERSVTRFLSLGEFEEWESLFSLLQQVSLNNDHIDSVIWALDSKGHFSTKSLYRFLSKDSRMKINFFFCGNSLLTSYRWVRTLLRVVGKGMVNDVCAIPGKRLIIFFSTVYWPD